MTSNKNPLKKMIAFVLALVMMLTPVQLFAAEYLEVSAFSSGLRWVADDVEVTRGAQFVDVVVRLENTVGVVAPITMTMHMIDAFEAGYVQIPANPFRTTHPEWNMGAGWSDSTDLMPPGVLSMVTGTLVPNATVVVRLYLTSNLLIDEPTEIYITRPIISPHETDTTSFSITRVNSTISIEVDEDGDVDVDVPPIWEDEWDGDTYVVGTDPDGNITITFPPGTDPDDIDVNLPCDDTWDYNFEEGPNGEVIVVITPPVHDIFVEKTSAETSAAAGGYINYSILVRNDGTIAATNLLVQDTLSANTTFVSSNYGTHVAGVVSHTIATLAPGASFTLTIQVRVNSDVSPGDTITNNVVVSGPGIDTDNPPGDNDTITVGNIIVDVEDDRSVTVTNPPYDGYNVTGDGPGDIGDIIVTFPPGTDPEDIDVNLPCNDTWDYNFEEGPNGEVILVITPPWNFTITFHLYAHDVHHAGIIEAFEDYTTGVSSDGFLTLVVPVNPGLASGDWIRQDLLEMAFGFENIYGAAGTPGHAFWGWFRDNTLNGSGRVNATTNLRRPALFNTCALAGLIAQIEDANTDTARNLLFGNAAGGNVDVFSVWSLWGDVNDDDVVDQHDLNILIQRIALAGIVPILLNERAANVVVDGAICQLDQNLLTQYVGLIGVFPVNPIVLGVRP